MLPAEELLSDRAQLLHQRWAGFGGRLAQAVEEDLCTRFDGAAAAVAARGCAVAGRGRCARVTTEEREQGGAIVAAILVQWWAPQGVFVESDDKVPGESVTKCDGRILVSEGPQLICGAATAI